MYHIIHRIISYHAIPKLSARFALCRVWFLFIWCGFIKDGITIPTSTIFCQYWFLLPISLLHFFIGVVEKGQGNECYCKLGTRFKNLKYRVFWRLCFHLFKNVWHTGCMHSVRRVLNLLGTRWRISVHLEGKHISGGWPLSILQDKVVHPFHSFTECCIRQLHDSTVGLIMNLADHYRIWL